MLSSVTYYLLGFQGPMGPSTLAPAGSLELEKALLEPNL